MNLSIGTITLIVSIQTKFLLDIFTKKTLKHSNSDCNQLRVEKSKSKNTNVMRIKEAKYAYAIHNPHSRPKGKFNKLLGLGKFLMTHKISYVHNEVNPCLSAAMQFREMVDWIHIDLDSKYIYPLDNKVVRCIKQEYMPIASVTVDYSEILSSCLNAKEVEVNLIKESAFKNSLQLCLDAIKALITNILSSLTAQDTRTIQLKNYFNWMIDRPCKSFDEAIQRILFYNAIFWQNKHKQNGIGRLDMILAPYYKSGINDGTLTREKAKKMLSDMCNILSKDMLLKSAALIGDTGQVIILGGIDVNANTVENELTHILFEIFTEKPVPDPKLILRVNKQTSDTVWQKAINCIIKGSGSPLIMNEEMILPLMKTFGYDKDDVFNFGTSACWEPLIIGKSFDQNNCIKNIIILDALKLALTKYKNESYDILMENLDQEIAIRIAEHDLNVEFDKAPVLSLYFNDCIKKEKDFSEGGAKYNNHGLLVVGLPNLVNSLLNIKKYVYDDNLCSLKDCLDCINKNYSGHEDLLQLFCTGTLKFGSAVKEVVELTNHIMKQVEFSVNKRTMKGEKIKVGFSSPSYIGLAKEYPASLDGRKQNEPFAVHISPVSSDIDIAEVLDFASQLKYEKCCINGNVVDFIIPTTYAKNPQKLKEIVKNAFSKELFELQLNVLDKATLTDAKRHPEKYPNLIVRVWGFSAYFNELPEEYKDNLINRAECYET